MMFPKASGAALVAAVLAGVASAQSSSSSAFPTYSFSNFFNTSSSTTSSATSSSSSSSVSSSSSSLLNSTTSSTTPTTITSSTSPGATLTTSSASSSSSTGVPLPAVTDVPTPFILGVQRNGGDAVRARGLVGKRQTNGGFVGGAGPVNPTDCSLATQFTIVAGQLVSGGEVVSTDGTVPYERIAVSATVGIISTVWGLTGDVVEWVNPAFVGGAAGFVQDLTGQVYATFDGPADVPAGSVGVTLIAIPASECVNGGIVTSLPPAEATLTLPAGIYFPGETPASECCSAVFESWVIGQTTLLP
ncbi:hypothetical protein NKR23_g5338 [Pleurostoma richardsiae]|uniref:DUF7908 domain-containing protein n=1 Tax=Pleurostoma richardsiae TaxID=41990 RepID=A0AA38RU27_9PEZI|nr:hypothetical protein NKR23_g5338 [Pleurostoma richardsiae]